MIHPLRLWMMENEISQRAFSQKTGISCVSLSKITNWKSEPKLRTIEKIRRATDFALETEDFVKQKVS